MGELIVLVVLRCCRQTSTLLRLIKHFCDLCINFSYTAGVWGVFSSFSVRGSKAVMNRRGIPDVVQSLHTCVVVAVCLGVSLL